MVVVNKLTADVTYRFAKGDIVMSKFSTLTDTELVNVLGGKKKKGITFLLATNNCLLKTDSSIPKR